MDNALLLPHEHMHPGKSLVLNGTDESVYLDPVPDDFEYGPNLLTNGSFETYDGTQDDGTADTFTGWTIASAAGVTHEATATCKSGTNAFKYNYASTSSPQFYQDVTVVPGTRYAVTFWTRGDGVRAARFRIRDVTHTADIVATTSTGVSGTTYTLYRSVVVAPAGCVSMRIEFFPASTTSAHVVYIDDVQIRQVFDLWVNVWVKRTADDAARTSHYVLSRREGAANQSWWLRFIGNDEGADAGDIGKVAFGVSTDGTAATAHEVMSSQVLAMDTWYLASVAFTAATGLATIYVNAVAGETFAGAYYPLQVEAPLRVGACDISGSEGWMEGEIGEMQIGRGKLMTAADVRSIYRIGFKENYPGATILAHYDWFGVSAWAFLADRSGNANHFTSSTVTRLDNQSNSNTNYRANRHPVIETEVDYGTVISSLGSMTEWTLSGAGVTAALDYGRTYGKTAGIHLTGVGAGNGLLTHTAAAPEDWTGRLIYLRFYIPDVNRSGAVQLQVRTDAANYFYRTITHFTGWNHAIISPGDFTASGSPNWASISSWVLRMSNSTEKPTECVFDALTVHNDSTIVVLTSDDGQEVNHTYRAAFSSRSLKCCAHIITDRIDTTGYLSKAQIDDLYALGWDICSHTVSHPYMDQVSLSQAEDEIAESKSVLLSNGWTRGSRFFAWPHTTFNDDLREISSRYYDISRSGSSFPHPHLPPGDSQLQRLCSEATDELSTAEFAARVDNAIARKGLFVTYAHDFTDLSTLETNLDYLVTKQTAGDLTVMTWSEYWAFLVERYGLYGSYMKE